MSKVKNVKVFSTNWCPYCKYEEAWLKEQKIGYEVVMVDEDMTAANYIVQKTGQRGVPVTEITFEKGEPQYVIGFDKPTLEHLLKD